MVAAEPRRISVAAMGGTLAMVGLGVFFYLLNARAVPEERETQSRR